MKNASPLSFVLFMLLVVCPLARAQRAVQSESSTNDPASAGSSRSAVPPASVQPVGQLGSQAGTQAGTPTTPSAGVRPDSLPQAPSHRLLSRLHGGAPASVAPGGRSVNGQAYVRPDGGMLVANYLRDTYGLPGIGRTTVTALYAEGRTKPTGWDTDAAGFGQRFGSAAAVTAINGTVRLGFETTLHEDLRYIPCHGCRTKQKIANALLSEITARHGEDGHRSFSLTPTISDMAGPIITHTLWYPGYSGGPEQGAVVARTVFATRIGAHLFEEFVWERRHKDVHGEMGSRRQ